MFLKMWFNIIISILIKRHNRNEFFCSKCLIRDGLFRGGGSWSPDRCPKCDGTDCTMYQDLTFKQKLKLMQREKYNEQKCSELRTI